MYRVLVVDDEDDIVEMLHSAFGKTYHVISCSTCSETKAITSQEPVDAVILDLRLPDGDGVELAQWLKQEHPLIPVLAISCRSTKDDVIKLLKNSVDNYFEKPFSIAEIRESLEALIRRKNMFDGHRGPVRFTASGIVRKVDDILSRCASENTVLSGVAKVIGVTPSYLSRTYKKHKGASFAHAKSLVRVQKAEELLMTTDLTIRQIAERTGFHSSSYFRRVFKSITQLTPGEFKYKATTRLPQKNSK